MDRIMDDLMGETEPPSLRRWVFKMETATRTIPTSTGVVEVEQENKESVCVYRC
jgi:hypothetical protein